MNKKNEKKMKKRNRKRKLSTPVRKNGRKQNHPVKAH